jgi:hypothetical protein
VAASCAVVTGWSQWTLPAHADSVFAVNLVDLGVAPERYTTTWPTGTNMTVMVWDAAFRAAHAALAANGGGRLIVPAAAEPYYLRDCQVFDLPTVTVELQAGSEIMMIGPKNAYLGAPLGFFGGLGDGKPPRVQRNYAAVLGPGKVGFPAAQLEYYERGNALAFSYIKTVVVDGVEVPCAPRFAMTAQYGCNQVTFRNNTIGYTGTPDEIKLGGHAVLNVSGGLYDDATGAVATDRLRTVVTIDKNTIGHGERAAYLEHCGLVSMAYNTIGPMDGIGVTIADSTGTTLTGNLFVQVSKAGPGSDVIQLVDVSDPINLHGNAVNTHTHRNCIQSRDTTTWPLRTGVTHARSNRWKTGTGPVFSGTPAWDSVGDTVS